MLKMALRKETLNRTQLEKDLTEFIGKYGLNTLQKHFGNLLKDSEVQVDLKVKEIPSLQQLMDIFKKRIKEVKFEQTLRTYSSEIDYFGLFTTYKLANGLNSKITDVMSPNHINEYLSIYKNQYTWNKKAAILRSFIKNECIEHLEKKRVTNLLDTLKIKDPQKNIPKAFLPYQVRFLLDESKNTQPAFRNYSMIWTFLGSGIRNSELVHLQIGDIYEESQIIEVIPKGSSTKAKRYITKVALQVLVHYINFKFGHLKKTLTKEKYNELFVFSVDGHKPLSTDTVRDIFDRLIKKGEKRGVFLEGNDFSPHTMRHSFALYLLEKGVSIYKIKKYLGHKSMKSTEVYLELFDFQMVNAIEKHPFAQLELSFLKNKGDLNEFNY